MTSAFSKVGEVICTRDGKGGWVDDLRVLSVWSDLVWAMIWLGACKRISCLGYMLFLFVLFFLSNFSPDKSWRLYHHSGVSLSLLPQHILLPRPYSTAGYLQACNPLHLGSKPFMAFCHMSHKFPSLAMTGLHNMALTALMPYPLHSSAPTVFPQNEATHSSLSHSPPFHAFVLFLFFST